MSEEEAQIDVPAWLLVTIIVTNVPRTDIVRHAQTMHPD